MRRFSRLCAWLACAAMLVGPSAARAEKVYVNDGRVLDGRFVRIEGVAVDPLNNNASAAAAKPILMCDDDLRRTMIPWRVVTKVDPVPPPRWETFKLDQAVADNGLPVATIGPIVRLQPFDQWGRRIFSMQTTDGVANVIQGLTTITPLWSRVESLKGGKAYLWDMRIATSSIPRDLLSKILIKQIDPRNPDQRLKLVRFYMQAERFADAEAELKQVIADFPAMAGLEEQAKAVRQLGAERVMAEVEMRRKAGQFGVAYGMLQRFPSQGISGTTLQAVREKIEAYRTAQRERDAAVKQFDAQLAQIKETAIRRRLQPIRDEIADELTIATLERLGPFRRLADDSTLLPEQKVALAVSGWLIGANEAVDNLQVAVSLVTTRKLVLDYLREPVKLNRDAMLESLGSQQSAAPKYVAAILSHMKPPIETPPQREPGSYELSVHGLENEPDVTYFVQLPPEYDPHVKYPAIVTLQGAGTTPEQQIGWWAGESRMPAADADQGAAQNGPQPNVQQPNAQQPNPPQQNAAGQPPAAGGNAVAAGGDAAPAVESDGPPIPDIHTMRLGQATRQGYIVIAPGWINPHQMQYQYSAREHAAVLDSLRDACRRFSIDTDRVFLSGHSMGADAAWDIALAHPDLWAGVIPIVGTAGKYVTKYWPNAEHLSLYFVSGELDANRTANNAPDWDRYLSQTRGWDMTLVEYEGRGHEHFSDEIQRIFDWMGRKKRDFYPREFKAVSERAWDNFFWCLELQEMPANCIVDPASWPPPRNVHPLNLEVKVNANNGINISVHTPKLAVWLSPEYVNFDVPVTITVGGTRLGTRHVVKPSVSTMLEDARTRADRMHPFWAKVE